MQLVKLKARLIAAGIFIVIAGLVMLLLGTSILSAFVGGNQAQLSTRLAGCQDQATSGGHTSGDEPAAPADVQAGQTEIVKDIEKAVKEEGVDGKAVRIVAIAGYGESTLQNIGYGDQDTSGTTNPDGSKATSLGFLQQQTSTGWGTKEEVMDPVHATKSFLLGTGAGNQGLLDIPGWQDMEPTDAIHKVQGNADAAHYVSFYGPAEEVIKKAGVSTDFDGKTTKSGGDSGNSGSGGDTPAGGSEAGKSSCGEGGKKSMDGHDPKNTYAWDDRTPRDAFEADPMGFFYGECTSYAGFKLNEFLGQSPEEIEKNPIYTNAIAGDGASWGHAWEANGWEVSDKPVPNSVAWWDANDGQGIGSSGHVAWNNDVVDGKAVIDEYNNAGYADGPHRYDARPEPVSMDDPEAPTAFLIPPEKDQVEKAGPKVG